MTQHLHPGATVIISVYNRLDFLRLVLAGFEIQTEKNFEVIISDDGSGPDFVKDLKQLISESPLNIQHNWHEDHGFRKNQILNSSVMLARSDYLIFVDGDCIPHPEFVAEHLHLSEQGSCLAGRRVDLSRRITEKLTPENIRNGILQNPAFHFHMLSDFVSARLFHYMNGFYTKSPILRRYFNRKERGLLGANFSLFKSDLLAINGFDERYRHPTFGEDSDVEFRLRLNGVRIKPILNIAVQYHCHHKLLPRRNESKQLYEQVVRERIAFTPFGIRKLS